MESAEQVIDGMSPQEAERAAAASFFAPEPEENGDISNPDLDNDAEEETTSAQEPDEEIKAEASVENTEEEISEEDDARIDELISKSGTEDLTDDEIEFLKSKGVEIQFSEEEKAEEKPEEKEETPYAFDDILSQVYDDEFETTDAKDEALREYIIRQNQASEKLYNVINSNPEFQAVVSEILNQGTDFRTALANHLDLDAVVPKPGEDGYKEWVANDIKRQQKLKEQTEKDEQYVRNQQQSVVATKNFLSSSKLEDGRARDFLGFVDGLINDFSSGKVTKGNLDQLYKAWSFDNELEKVQEESKQKEKIAEARGANRKIIAITRKKSGDKVRNLKSGGAGRSRPKSNSIITSDIVTSANESFMDRAKRLGVVDKVQ